ncbi:50S ribosomal protein L7/L12 [Aphanothece hegewaldii CCALA 016]|uniref:50S ribosomal protein L7/L12 n=1 Tax=Aphanothece hegewaldii CCALA 016 TaxID=2107694 RepID=A0A2T1LR96_9CHRO|nr:ribosomal protein L7/L12 [Aphanothece hegewaldii]PSF30992.1 50S ribosomal protein L7/L12 [Aphanothece hegewaldii CCALA 016]
MNKRLEQLLKKQEELKAQIQKIKAAEATQKRKSDTRKKILLGALVMEMMDLGELDKNVMMKRLDGFLSREGDRTLFNLPPVQVLKSEPTSSSESAAFRQSFEVILEDHGTDKIKALKTVRNVTNLGLKEAKDLVESAPTLLMKVNNVAQAQEIKKQFFEFGATVTVRKSLD